MLTVYLFPFFLVLMPDSQKIGSIPNTKTFQLRIYWVHFPSFAVFCFICTPRNIY